MCVGGWLWGLLGFVRVRDRVHGCACACVGGTFVVVDDALLPFLTVSLPPLPPSPLPPFPSHP